MPSIPRNAHSLTLAILCAATAHPGVATAETLVGPYPFAVGDKFVFDHTSTDTVQSGSGEPVVTTQTYTETTTILAAVKIAYPPSSGGTVTAYPFQTVASWSTADGKNSVKTIEYRNFVAGGGTTNYLDYGFNTVTDLAQPDGVTLHKSEVHYYGTPLILDELPQTSGASWVEPIVRTVVTDNYYITGTGDSNVLDSKEITSADGSYSESGMDTDVPFAIVQKSNGTGTETRGPSNSQEEWSFALPKSSADGDVIPVTVTFDGKTGVNEVPDWFPGGHAAPNPLTTQAMTDKGNVAVPAGCGKYAGKTARLLVLTYGQVAPVSGYTWNESDGFYVISKVGRVCLTVAYTRIGYDSKVTGKVVSTETYSSQEGMIKETVK